MEKKWDAEFVFSVWLCPSNARCLCVTEFLNKNKTICQSSTKRQRLLKMINSWQQLCRHREVGKNPKRNEEKKNRFCKVLQTHIWWDGTRCRRPTLKNVTKMKKQTIAYLLYTTCLSMDSRMAVNNVPSSSSSSPHRAALFAFFVSRLVPMWSVAWRGDSWVMSSCTCIEPTKQTVATRNDLHFVCHAIFTRRAGKKPKCNETKRFEHFSFAWIACMLFDPMTMTVYQHWSTLHFDRLHCVTGSPTTWHTIIRSKPKKRRKNILNFLNELQCNHKAGWRRWSEKKIFVLSLFKFNSCSKATIGG